MKIKDMRLNPIETFSQAINLYKKKFQEIFSLFFPISIILSLSTLLSQETIGGAVFAALVNVLILIAALFAYWSAIFIFSEGVKPAEALKRTAKKFWSLVFVVFLANLVKLGSFSLVILASLTIFLIYPAVGVGITIIALIPAVILSIWILFSEIICIIEGKKGWSALLKSREYSRGNGWMIFWNLIFFLLLLIIVGAVFGLVNQSAPSLWFIWSLISNFLIGSFSIAFIFSMFKTISEKGEPEEKSADQKRTKTIFVVFSCLTPIVLVTLLILAWRFPELMNLWIFGMMS